ncbi:MAG: YbhB/YbcL family Raf kinase inhibitor-like protein [Isosphaeraceae bacterium]
MSAVTRWRTMSKAEAILLCACLSMAGCGGEPGKFPVLDPNRPKISLTSTAFGEGQLIPRQFACDGDNLSPPLSWSNIPPETRTLVLLCDDPDAPMRTWSHWVVFNITPDLTEFGEGIAAVESLKLGDRFSIRQGKNDFGTIGYGGPCPPSGTHRYFFRIYAVDMVLNLGLGTDRSAVLKAMEGHVLAEGSLVGKYARIGG